MKLLVALSLILIPISASHAAGDLTFNCILRQGKVLEQKLVLTLGGEVTTIDLDESQRLVIGANRIPKDAKAEIGDIYFGLELQDRHKPDNDTNVIASAWAASQESVSLLTIALGSLTLSCRQQ